MLQAPVNHNRKTSSLFRRTQCVPLAFPVSFWFVVYFLVEFDVFQCQRLVVVQPFVVVVYVAVCVCFFVAFRVSFCVGVWFVVDVVVIVTFDFSVVESLCKRVCDRFFVSVDFCVAVVVVVSIFFSVVVVVC